MSETDETTDEPVVACTLTEDEREIRREEHGEVLLPRFEDATELEDGYLLTFEGSAETVRATAEFVVEEARCCSFASFSVEYEPPYEAVGLRFTGPEGTKDLLCEGFADVDAVSVPS